MTSPKGSTIVQERRQHRSCARLIADSGVAIELRQSKYLNNIVEQDHRAIKRRTRPMMGFKSFWSARRIIAGIETMHMIKKGQQRCPSGNTMSAADRFTAWLIETDRHQRSFAASAPLLRHNQMPWGRCVARGGPANDHAERRRCAVARRVRGKC